MLAWFAIGISLLVLSVQVTIAVVAVQLSRNPQILAKAVAKSMSRRKTSTVSGANVTFEVPRAE